MIFTISLEPLLNFVYLLKDLIFVKYRENLKNDYKHLGNADDIAKYILQELIDQMIHYGLKNILIFYKS